MYSPGGPDKPVLFLIWSLVMFVVAGGALAFGVAEGSIPALALAGVALFGALGFALQVVTRRRRGQGWNET